jgi:hypothetical protein
MTLDDLTAALNGLSTARLQRLADGLQRDPDAKVTVGAWRPRCPMVLAGYDPPSGSGNGPEDRFADTWDRFAAPASAWRLLPRPVRDARVSDVQALLRATNAVLAARFSCADAEHPIASPPAAVGADGGQR